jgi:hypothetical protein
LAEATDEDDAGNDASFRTETVDLAGDKVADFLDDGFEDVFDLLRCHNEEARVQSCFFIIGQSGEAKDEKNVSSISHN